MKFIELKAKLDALTPEQLAHDVIWWGDDRGGTIDSLLVLPEDFVNIGEGMEPLSGYADATGGIEEAASEGRVMRAGTPVLCTDGPAR